MSNLMTKTKKIIADDGLIATEVGVWAKEKHNYLKRYIAISHGVRKKFITGAGGATYIDLFCGSGRGKIKNTNEWIDGSSIVAWKKSQESGSPFSAMYINDLDKESVDACYKRLSKLGAPVQVLNITAIDASSQLLKTLNPHGLHLVFIDPYSLGALDFQIIQNLANLKRVDAIVHISSMDLQRNMSMNTNGEKQEFDSFAPGWREYIDMKAPNHTLKMRVVEYWRDLVEKLGKWPSNYQKHITGEKNQTLYWLTLLANNKLAHEFWGDAINPEGQGDLFGE